MSTRAERRQLQEQQVCKEGQVSEESVSQHCHLSISTPM